MSRRYSWIRPAIRRSLGSLPGPATFGDLRDRMITRGEGPVSDSGLRSALRALVAAGEVRQRWDYPLMASRRRLYELVTPKGGQR